MNPAGMSAFSQIVVHMAALAVSVERIIEILKGFWRWWPLNPAPGASAAAERLRCAVVQLVSAAIGTALCWGGHINLLHTNHVRAGYIAAGLLASAGSAFWNHILDYVKAAKVVKENAAQAALGANSTMG